MSRSILARPLSLALLGCLGLLSLAAAQPVPSDQRTIFVYGSLKSGEYNHCRIADQEFLGLGSVRDYGLYVSHDRYPYAAALEGARIVGEVYRVDAATGALLDAFEGSDGYYPEPVWVRLRTGQLIVAEIYIVGPDRLAELGAQRYRSPIWRGPMAEADEC
ncbi:MAG TPA: gamma-glutamylcyclotransferase family protein [Dehalococcoidia bacterium]|nr:gamma-glutamylcyclotransferase family protein [Dehalococcoidia bacterium]